MIKEDLFILDAEKIGDHLCNQWDTIPDGCFVGSILLAMGILADAGHEGCSQRIASHQKRVDERARIDIR